MRFAPDDDLIGGRLLLERFLASGNMLYMSLSRGYKAGGFNTSSSLDADLREFDPESLWNMEAGFKGRLMDDRLALSATIFRMQRRDVQIATSITRLRNDGSAEFIGYTGNGAEGVNQGVEFEAVLQAADRFQLTASVGLLDAEFEDYVNGSGEDLDGRDQAQAPGYQFYLAADYRFSQALGLNISIEGKDDYYFSDGHAEQSRVMPWLVARFATHGKIGSYHYGGATLAIKITSSAASAFLMTQETAIPPPVGHSLVRHVSLV